MAYQRYVAVGDSCAEGLDDPYPDGSGYRGWADLTAEQLAAPGFQYANLAVRGRRLDQILAEQVPTARDPRYFGADRLHLGELGHRRVAAHLLGILGETPDEAWLAPLPPAGRVPYWRNAARQWDWVRNHVVPAVHGTVRNRLIGRQPGDGFVPKRPELSSVD